MTTPEPRRSSFEGPRDPHPAAPGGLPRYFAMDSNVAIDHGARGR